MDIKDFEMFHGIVLTKILRSDNPTSLRMIETNKKELWSAYKINDEVILCIKYRTAPRKMKKSKGLSWTFIFTHDELHQIGSLSSNSKKPLYLALVCVHKKPISVCFLEPNEVRNCLDLSVADQKLFPLQPQNITVQYQANKSLRAFGSREQKELVIPRNRINTWKIPGS